MLYREIIAFYSKNVIPAGMWSNLCPLKVESFRSVFYCVEQELNLYFSFNLLEPELFF